MNSSRRVVLLTVLSLAVTGCAILPRSGPTSGAIDSREDASRPDGLVAPVDARAVALMTPNEPAGFPDAFLRAAPFDPDVLAAGDVVELTVWEGEGGGLFSGGRGGAIVLPAIAIASDGFVDLPYAGRIRAGGRTIRAFQDGVRAQLAPLILSPEISARLVEPAGRRVSVQGAVAAPGVFALDHGLTRLSGLLARAGGATVKPDLVAVSVLRDGVRATERLSRIYAAPERDIALRPGDAVLAAPAGGDFSVLGAASVQAQIPFASDPFDLLSAIAAARGLRDFEADPAAVFVFRFEDPAVADALLDGPPPPGLPTGEGRPIIYHLDLSSRDAIFLARRFQMRDGDALFAANAPLTELRKLLQLFNSVFAPVVQTNAIAPIQ